MEWPIREDRLHTLLALRARAKLTPGQAARVCKLETQMEALRPTLEWMWASYWPDAAAD